MHPYVRTVRDVVLLPTKIAGHLTLFVTGIAVLIGTLGAIAIAVKMSTLRLR